MNNNPLAFPQSVYRTNPDVCGMTLRDYFAAAALTGNLLSKSKGSLDVHVQLVATASYAIADAMLKAREQ